MMHPIYLPFTKNQLKSHFADVRKGNYECTGAAGKHIEYYKKSIQKYENYHRQNPDRTDKPISELKVPCQIEKDEKFWTTSCLMTIYYSENRTQELVTLFKKAYGSLPPFADWSSWEECFEGNLPLFFEAKLPSPKSYKDWLRSNLVEQQFIPYILDSNNGRKNLEGPTNADAVLINPGKGFSVIIEAKVLSDISYHTTYNVTRNQIARNIDVMLEKNTELCTPLNQRDPDKTLFLLLTPGIFKENPSSRLYGFKFNEYRTHPESLKKDLPHRRGYDWSRISRRLGWLTWEDSKKVNKDCCRWLKPS